MAGLFLSDLALSHFRSHRAGALRLDGRPVAVFGPNGAGKTNILEAVSLLSPGRGLRRAAPEDIMRQPEVLGWKVSAVVHCKGQVHEIETRAQGAGPREVRIDTKAEPQLALGRILRVLWLVPAMDRIWTESADGRRRFLDRITLSLFPGHAEAALAYDKAMRQRNRLFRDGATDAAWYGALEAQMARNGAAVVANRAAALARLARAQHGAATVFPAATLAIVPPADHPGPLTEAELALAFASDRRRDMAAGRALSGPHRVDLGAVYDAKGIAAAQWSTGEQKALLISLILSNARALAQDFGAPPILLLDEVAAHLDAARRTALYDEVCAMGAQAFLTGTEAGLFSALGTRAQGFELRETGGVSEILERDVA